MLYNKNNTIVPFFNPIEQRLTAKPNETVNFMPNVIHANSSKNTIYRSVKAPMSIKRPDTNAPENLKVVQQLKNINFFNVIGNSKVAANTNKKAQNVLGMDVNKIQSNTVTLGYATDNASQTLRDLVDPWERIKDFEENNSGFIYAFDTETFGATRAGQRWGPLGMTEFALHKYDYGTKKVETTSIALLNPMNMEKIEKQYEAIAKTLKTGGIEALKKDQELYVTAMRLSLYDPQAGMKAEKTAAGYFKITALNAEKANAGNIAAITRGFKAMQKMSNGTAIDPTTGLSVDVLGAMQAIGDMQVNMNKNIGVMTGHNIIDFDVPVINSFVTETYQQQQDKLARATTDIEKKQAQKAIDFIESNFKTKTGTINFNPVKGQTFDTLPFTREFTREHTADLINMNPEVAKELQGKYNTLEALGRIFFGKDYEKSAAHVADFDAYENLRMFVKLPSLVDGSVDDYDKFGVAGNFIDFAMQRMYNNDYTKFDGIELREGSTLLKAKNMQAGANFSNRNFLSFVQFENGNVMTNGSYSILDGKVQHTKFPGNTNFSPDAFYQFQRSGKINIADLDEQTAKLIRDTYIDNDAESLFFATFNLSTGIDKTGGRSVTIVANSEERLNAALSNSLDVVGHVNKENKTVKLAGNRMVHKVFEPGNTYDLLDQEIKNVNQEQALKKVSNQILRGDRALKKVHDIVAFSDALEGNPELKKFYDAWVAQGKTMYDLVHLDSKDKNVIEIQKLFKQKIGFMNRETKQLTLFDSTKATSSSAFEFIHNQKDYYKTLIDEIVKVSNVKTYDELVDGKHQFDYKNMNQLFVNANEQIRYNHELKKQAKQRKGKVNIRRAVKDALAEDYIPMSHDEFVNNIEIRTPRSFKPLEESLKVKGSIDQKNENIVYRMDKTNRKSRLINSVFSKYTGIRAEEIKKSPEAYAKYKEEALAQYFKGFELESTMDMATWFNDLDIEKNEVTSYMFNEYDNPDLELFLERVNSSIHGLSEGKGNVDEAVDQFDQYMRVLSAYRDHALNRHETMTPMKKLPTVFNIKDEEKLKEINSISSDEMFDTIKNIKNTVNSFNINDEKQFNSVIEDLLDKYTMSNKEFAQKTKGLTDRQRLHRNIIRDDIREKTRTMLKDVFKTSQKHGFDIILDEDYNMIIRNQATDEYVPITKLQRLEIKDGQLVMNTGTTERNLWMDLRYDRKTGYFTLSSNLDENFGKEDYFFNQFERDAYNGLPYDLNKFNKGFSIRRKELMESSIKNELRGSYQDMNSNIDISILTKGEVLKGIVQEDGINYPKLMKLIREGKIQNTDLIDVIKKDARYLGNDDELMPDKVMYGISDWIQIAKALGDPNDPRLAKVLSTTGTSGKETNVADLFLSADERRTGHVNTYFGDALGRPVPGQSGNAFWLDKERMAEAEKGGRVFAVGSDTFNTKETYERMVKRVGSKEYTTEMSHRQAYLTSDAIVHRMEKSRDEVIKNANIMHTSVEGATEEAKQKVYKKFELVYDKVLDDLRAGTFEQARILDSRLIDMALNRPADVQYFSNNNTVTNIRRLIEDEADQNLMIFGAIINDKNGNLQYVKGDGLIVKRGQAILDYEGFADTNQVLTSKFKTGVFGLSVRDEAGHELSSSKISEIINKHKDKFLGKTYNDKTMNMFDILDKEGYKVNFKIEDINNMVLPKTNDNSAEKGMDRTLQMTLGSFDEKLKTYFESLQKATEEKTKREQGLNTLADFLDHNNIPNREAFLNRLHKRVDDYVNDYGSVEEINKFLKIDFLDKNGKINEEKLISYIGRDIDISDNGNILEDILGKAVPTEQGINAILSHYRMALGFDEYNRVLKASGFENIKEVKKAILDERHLMSDALFGEHGAFAGFESIANDAIVKHKNTGFATFGRLNEAVTILGKYDKGTDKDSIETYQRGIDILERYLKNDKFNPFEVVNQNGTVRSMKIGRGPDGGIMLEHNTDYEEWNQLNEDKMKNLFEALDKRIVASAKKNNIDLNPDDRLVHNDVYIKNKNGELEQISKYYGTVISHVDDQGRRVIDGSKLFVNSNVIKDSETQTFVSQEYLDKKLRYQEARSRVIQNRLSGSKQPTSLTDRLILDTKDTIEAESKFSTHVKMDDVIRNMLRGQRISKREEEMLEERLANSDIAFDKVTALALGGFTHGAVSYDPNTGKFAMDESLKGFGTNDYFLDYLDKGLFYNKYDEVKLTENMLNAPEFEHLRPMYNRITSRGYEAGLDTTQNLYDLEKAFAAHKFNSPNSKVTVEDMVKQGFEVKSIDEYIPTFNRNASDAIGSNISKATIIDLGEELGDNRYVAVPGGGIVVKDQEIGKKWHSKVDKLKRLNDRLVSMEGEGIPLTSADMTKYGMDSSLVNENAINARNRIKQNMIDTRQEINELIGGVVKKEGPMNAIVKQNVQMPSHRAKILSTIGEVQVDSRFKNFDATKSGILKKAQFNGTSLEELQHSGVHIDYGFTGIEHFQMAGFFDDNIMKEFGFTKEEQMVDYLSTHGAQEIGIRFPAIRRDSGQRIQMYLDTSLNGQNAYRLSGATVLKQNGDSDGDSESMAMVKYDNVTSTLHERRRDVARENLIKNDADFVKRSEREQQRAIRDEVLKTTGMDPEMYDSFEGAKVQMLLEGATVNNQYMNDVAEAFGKNTESNARVGAVFMEKKDGSIIHSVAEMDKARSKLLSTHAFGAYTAEPSIEARSANIDVVNATIQKAQGFAKQLNMDDVGVLANFDSANKSITQAGSIKNNLLDETALVYERAQQAGLVSKDEYGQISAAIQNRIRTTNYFEEAASKAGKNAIGNTNASINAYKQVAATYFAEDAQDNLFRRDIIADVGRDIEQNIISAKKKTFEIGDTRLLDMEELLKKAGSKKGLSRQDTADFETWVDQYMGEGSISQIFLDNFHKMDEKQKAAYENIRAKIGGQSGGKTLPLNDEQEYRAKLQFVVSEFKSGIHQISLDDSTKGSLELQRRIAHKHSSLENLDTTLDFTEDSARAKVVNMILGKEAVDGYVNNQETIMQQRQKEIEKIAQESAERLKESTVKHGPFTVPPTNNISGIAIKALGLAAGVMMLGYATGGHSKPQRSAGNADENNHPSVPEFFGGETPSEVVAAPQNSGYIINVRANSKKGERHLKRAMREAVNATVGGGVNINMNIRRNNTGGYSNSDIQDVINNYI